MTIEATSKRTAYLITIVASLGGLLFGYDTAVISGAVGAPEDYLANSLESNVALAVGSIFQFKVIISSCILAGGFFFGFSILNFFKRSTAHFIIFGILLLSGAMCYFQFLTLPDVLTENLTNFILGFMISGALVGCIIVASMGDKEINFIGHRNGLILSAVLFFVSACASFYPEAMNIFFANGLTFFIIYYIVSSVAVGLVTMFAPIYIVEMAPAGIREKLHSFNQFIIVTVMLLVYVVNYLIVTGKPEVWITEVGWGVIIAVAIQWLANLMVSWMLPMMNQSVALVKNFHQEFSSWIYGGVAILSGTFTWKFVPETRGRMLEDVENLWIRKK